MICIWQTKQYNRLNTTSVMPLAGGLFGSFANPITTRGADAHHIPDSPPRFENPAASLLLDFKMNLKPAIYGVYGKYWLIC